jgi:hypothetical protein
VNADVLAATEQWFLHHGLTYFVPEQRSRVRSALRPRRVVPLVLLVLVVATGAGGLLAWVADQVALGPAALASLLIVAGLWYALTQLRAGPIVRWALMRTLGSLRTLLPTTTRALPLLLLFVTFLFISTEVWQVSSNLSTGQLWLAVLLFLLIGVCFLLVRLPEEVDRTDDNVDERLLLAACTGTPLEQECRRLVDDPSAEPAAYAEVTGLERWNLVLVLIIVQAVQVVLVSLAVFAFLMVFGSLIMDPAVLHQDWAITGDATVALLQVSTFLAGFSGLYLTVSTVTDETYREQFFGHVLHEMERAIGVRAVYLALRDGGGRAQGQAPGQAQPTT